MTDVVINRWKRYGHDRAYAAHIDGTALGWMDLKTGAVVIAEGADDAAVTEALWEWAAREAPSLDAGTETPNDTSAPDDVPVLDIAPAPHGDLALNQPGEQLRDKARKAWEAEKRAGSFMAYLARALDADTEERAWRRGIEGEQVIGAALDGARKHGWKVLHSIPLGKESDIDHLVIGPGGVVLVNTKHHKGAKVTVRSNGIFVNGAQTKHVLQVRSQVERAARILSTALGEPVAVHGCVAIHNGGLMEPEIKFAHHFKDVWVVSRWNIVRVLRKTEPVLTPEQVEAIFEVARRSDTWA